MALLDQVRLPLQRLHFEVQQLSQGAGGRLRVRTLQSDGQDALRCTIDSCVPGKAYVFQVRASAEVKGRILSSAFSEPLPLGDADALIAQLGHQAVPGRPEAELSNELEATKKRWGMVGA